MVHGRGPPGGPPGGLSAQDRPTSNEQQNNGGFSSYQNKIDIFSEENQKRTVKILDPISTVQKEGISRDYKTDCRQSKTSDVTFVLCETEERAKKLVNECLSLEIRAEIAWEETFTFIINLKGEKTEEEIERNKPAGAIRCPVSHGVFTTRIFAIFGDLESFFQSWSLYEDTYDIWLPKNTKEALKGHLAIVSHSDKYTDENRSELRRTVRAEMNKFRTDEVIIDPMGKSGCSAIYFKNKDDRREILAKKNWKGEKFMSFWSAEKKGGMERNGGDGTGASGDKRMSYADVTSTLR